MNWDIGDKCLCEFKEQEIIDIEYGCIRTVSDGTFLMSGSDLSDECFPVTIRGLCISESFERDYRTLSDRASGQFNFPDFKRHAISEWCKAMKAQEQQETDMVEAIWLRFHSWRVDVINYIDAMNCIEIGGVRVMRRK